MDPNSLTHSFLPLFLSRQFKIDTSFKNVLAKITALEDVENFKNVSTFNWCHGN